MTSNLTTTTTTTKTPVRQARIPSAAATARAQLANYNRQQLRTTRLAAATTTAGSFHVTVVHDARMHV